MTPLPEGHPDRAELDAYLAKMNAPTELKNLYASEDVTEEMLSEVADCLDGWFDLDEPLATEDFIDRYCNTYLNSRGWDIDNYDSPATRKLLREARKIRAEQRQWG